MWRGLWVLGLCICLATGISAAPKVDVFLSRKEVKQGQFFKLTLQSSLKFSSAEAKIENAAFKIFKQKTEGFPDEFPFNYGAYLAVSRFLSPKKYPLVISLVFENGEKTVLTETITVLDAGFPKEHIKLTPKKNKLAKDTKTLSNENVRLDELIKNTRTDQRYFDFFERPVQGSITSPFGGQRIYNGVPAWSHSGVDIGAKAGTPILAPSAGVVLLAEPYHVHGNTVLIDHGYGILSVYNHLSFIGVKEGQRVKRGEEIGHVGSTGIATGPHLHWGISVQNVRVNPMDFLNDKGL